MKKMKIKSILRKAGKKQKVLLSHTIRGRIKNKMIRELCNIEGVAR